MTSTLPIPIVNSQLSSYLTCQHLIQLILLSSLKHFTWLSGHRTHTDPLHLRSFLSWIVLYLTTWHWNAQGLVIGPLSLL